MKDKIKISIIFFGVFILSGCTESTYYVYVPKCIDSSYRSVYLDKYIKNDYLEIENRDAVIFIRENIRMQDLLIGGVVDNISNANNSSYKKKYVIFNPDGSYLIKKGLDGNVQSFSVDVLDEATKLECYTDFRNSFIKLMSKVDSNYIYP